VELHAHVPLLIASCAPCDGPDGLPTGNGSAGITVVESASAAATITADFISEIFSLPTCAASSWRTPPSQPRARGLFDHLVGKRDQRRGKFDAKQLGCLEIDDELEIGGSLNRQIGRFGTFQYLVYVAGSTSI